MTLLWIKFHKSELILCLLILLFGIIIPGVVWLEENKLSSVFQSLGILTAFLALFTHIIRENKKERKVLGIVIMEIGNLLRHFRNSLNENDFETNRQTEFELIANSYKNDLKKLHIYINETYDLMIITTPNARYTIDTEKIQVSKKDTNEYIDITTNEKEQNHLISELYKWI